MGAVAGRIRREDVQSVRERARIEDIVGEHVTLRSAGVGSMKGLCPFHDEKSPSFHVRPQVGLWHCFGCSEGGDVISFVQKIDGLPFAEAVEYLAGRVGLQLRYEEGGAPRPGEQPGRRQRLLEAHRVAATFFAEQLATPGAAAARAFLAERGFDRSAAEQFGVGYAPQGWDALQRHLRGRGFTEDELKATGLMSEGNRGMYDRFRGRLVWPIREVTGDTVGFGARKLYEEDQGPKYLNTPETALYKKSQVLYGIDLAKREIAKAKRVVVVEGYTDVMAMHLSGEGTAVATCGTAFGPDHARIVRRLVGDTGSSGGVQLASGASVGGEIIFTFDGDAAGQKAAMRAFGEDQTFSAQTFVAVEASGMDPCELRQAKGPDAVLALVAGRLPLFEFVIRTTLRSFDLDRAEGRVGALRSAVPVVAGIRDRGLRLEYARLLAGWLGMDEESVRQAVGSAVRSGPPARPSTPGTQGSGRPDDGQRSVRGGERRFDQGRGGDQRGDARGQRPGGQRVGAGQRDGGGRGDGFGRGESRGQRDGRGARTSGNGWRDDREPPPDYPPDDGAGGWDPGPGASSSAPQSERMPMPDRRDPVARTERTALEVVLQYPQLCPPDFDALAADAFTTPAYRAVHEAVRAAGGLAAARDVLAGDRASGGWVDLVREEASSPVLPLVTELAVAPLPEDRPDALAAYVRDVVGKLVEIGVTRAIADLKGRLQRMDSGADPEDYQRVFTELIALESRRRMLRESA
jgi:DNA primase